MIIECPACNARFRLDEARIKGRGARVRCRRCGETIVALKPEEPREEEKSAGDDFLDLRSVVRETMGEKTAEPQPEPSCAEAPPEARDEVDTAFEGFLAPAKGEREESAPPKEEPRPAEEGSGAFPAGELAIEFRPEKKLELDLPVEPPAENLEPDFLRGGAGTLDISASLREEPQDFLIGTETPPAFEPPPPAASGQPHQAEGRGQELPGRGLGLLELALRRLGRRRRRRGGGLRRLGQRRPGQELLDPGQPGQGLGVVEIGRASCRERVS
jgi:predicted Zn finger-like uncharacterized protein